MAKGNSGKSGNGNQGGWPSKTGNPSGGGRNNNTSGGSKNTNTNSGSSKGGKK